MKVLMVNGSTRPNGNTAAALHEMEAVFHSLGVETEIFQMDNEPLHDCIGCAGCRGKRRCVFDDDALNRFLDLAEQADGYIFAAPVYYAHPSGRILSLLDRAFYAGRRIFEHKPGAAVSVARRAGTTASCDVLNKYFTIAEMPVVSSSYWNMVFGQKPGECCADTEGMQTVRNLARNMAWLLRCIELGRENGVVPEGNEYASTMNFLH